MIVVAAFAIIAPKEVISVTERNAPIGGGASDKQPKIKLIMSDMDGTLLDEEGRLPEEFGEIAAELKRRGVIFAPASGRQYFSLREMFSEWADDFIFFAENGTIVKRRDEELFSSTMDKETALNILGVAAANPEIFRVYCGKRDAYVLKEQKRPEFVNELMRYYTHSSVVGDFAEVDDECIKVSLYDASGNADKVIYPLVEKFNGRQQVVLSSAFWVDVMTFGINKGLAIQQVQKLLGIAPVECAAFGDFLNDAEMMSSVYYSFAMGNAHPDIKKLARYTTDTNAEHGVIKGIRRLIDQGLCGEV